MPIEASNTPGLAQDADLWIGVIGSELKFSPAKRDLDKDRPTETTKDSSERKLGEYPVAEYADGWSKVTRESLPEDGSRGLKELVDEFGREVITGEIDAKKLAALIKSIDKTDPSYVEDNLKDLNGKLKREGLKLDVVVDSSGSVSEITMKEAFKPDVWQTALSINSAGDIRSSKTKISLQNTSKGLIERQALSTNQASLLLAKKVSALACP